MLEALENPVKREFSRAFLRSIFDFYDVIENKRLETEEKQYYDCCGAVTVGQEPHEWEDGKCAECGYGCTHSGGTATCTARAVCELCGQPYGEKAPDNHTGQEAWVTTAESHTKVYSCCKAVIQQSGSGTSTSGGTSAKDSPKTGDDTAAGFWMGAMTVSALLAACCLVLYRKKKA